jgi:hypothetical protein
MSRPACDDAAPPRHGDRRAMTVAGRYDDAECVLSPTGDKEGAPTTMGDRHTARTALPTPIPLEVVAHRRLRPAAVCGYEQPWSTPKLTDVRPMAIHRSNGRSDPRGHAGLRRGASRVARLGRAEDATECQDCEEGCKDTSGDGVQIDPTPAPGITRTGELPTASTVISGSNWRVKRRADVVGAQLVEI